MGKPLTSRLSGGATEPSQPDPPLWSRPPPNPSPRPDSDLILTRFGPEKADFGSEPGQTQVKIGSESGLGMHSEGVGSRGVGPAGKAL